RYHVFVLDEMNIARVEHYLAEILSAIERRSAVAGGGYETAPLLPTAPEEWSHQTIPPNLLMVGTVNMDESAHGFSRKVIDRAFTLEVSDLHLDQWTVVAAAPTPKSSVWPQSAWHPRAVRLSELRNPDEAALGLIRRVVDALE